MDAVAATDLSALPGLADLFAEQGVRFAYLFGSRADGTDDATSDIDIALYFDKGDPTERFRRATTIQRTIQTHLQESVDVVVLDEATPVLRFEAMRPSCVIYEDDEESRLALELRWFHDYEDYCYRLSQYMKVLAEELEERRRCSTTPLSTSAWMRSIGT